MRNILIKNNVLVYCERNTTGEVVIPKGLSKIDAFAFSGCKWITSVIIPDGVTEIGIGAFRDCIRLASIVIPSSVTEIGGSAFCGCFSLQNAEIPEGVDEIQDFTFYDCSSLTTVKLPETLRHIGDYAFAYCYFLDNVRLPDGLVSIGNLAFTECESLSFIEIPNVTSVGDAAFSFCSFLKSMLLPESISGQSDSFMQNGVWWREIPVLESYSVRERLYAGEHPLKTFGIQVQDRIDKFLSFGITHFVDLTEEGECEPYAHLLPDGATHYRFPIKKNAVPQSCSSMNKFLEYIKGVLTFNTHAKIYIHGNDDVGRTGLLAACFYVHSGDDYNLSLLKLRKSFRGCAKYSISSAMIPFDQDMFVCEYDEWLRHIHEQLPHLSFSKDEIPVSKPNQDRVRGSLYGGAIGDAVWFSKRYTSELEVNYLFVDEELEGAMLISDATQLSILTACGLIYSDSSAASVLESISEAYLAWNTYHRMDWYHSKIKDSIHVKRFIEWVRYFSPWRCPDGTCVAALEALADGKEVHNDSKSCGGVMRVAPIALFGLSENRFADIYAMDKMAVDVARITHKNPLGFLPALIVAHVIYRLAIDDTPTRDRLCYFIQEALSVADELYPALKEDIDYLRLLLKKTLLLAGSQHSLCESISLLGEGWNADEAMAMAFYCAIRYFDHFEVAIDAVQHIENSNTIAAIIGNILGAAMGYKALPDKYKPELYENHIECSRWIIKAADNLCR